jgi:chromosome segregation ATPase
MIHSNNDDLVAVVRELARPTTPRELELRGVRPVRSIGMGAVSLLIEKAVNRTLMKRTIGGLAEGEREPLIEEARQEFAQQLAELQTLKDSRELVERQRARVRADLDALDESAVAPEPPAPEIAAARAAERRRELRARIQAVLQTFADAPQALPRITDELTALFDEHERAALDEQRRRLEARIELEKRRVAKLVATLETTEVVLAELARAKDLARGMASIYPAVKGISVDEADYQRKIALLRRIFDSNLTLHDAIPSR